MNSSNSDGVFLGFLIGFFVATMFWTLVMDKPYHEMEVKDCFHCDSTYVRK